MLLIDNSQIILANIFQAAKDTETMNEDYIRHTVLNTYKKYRVQFRDFGELVVCNDGNDYWRKKDFPYYKQNRRKQQESRKEEWAGIFKILDKIRDEIKEVFPYPSIRVKGAEADDVIYVLTKAHYQTEPVLILSNDKDFQQLQIFPNVKQYSPMTKEFITCPNPREYLFNQILSGDSSDGVPNILSDDDTFVTDGKRQVRMTQKKITQLKEEAEHSSFFENPKYIRNKTLIDLTSIPDDIQERILEEFNSQQGKGREKLLDYFMEHKLKTLLPDIEEF